MISGLYKSEVGFLGQRAERAPSTFATIASIPIFSVAGGRVAVTSFIGEIVIAPFGAGLNNIHLVLNPDVGVPHDLDDGTADIDSAPVGTQIYCGFDPTDPLILDTVVETLTMLPLLPPGVISFATSAATGGPGQIKWVAFYYPFDRGATLVPR